MKRWLCLLFTLLLISALCVPVFAADSAVVDHAGLLDEDEINDLEETLEEVSEKYDIDIVVLTVESLEGKTAQRYAIDYYDDRYGDDGVLLLVAMEDRQWHFITAGKCKTRIPDGTFEDSDFVGMLSDGDYYGAFTEFARTCDRKMASYKVFAVLICFGVGTVVGLVAVLIMKSKLKTVRPQAGADQYVGADSLQLTHRSDIFLYQTVTRRPRPQQSSGGGRTGSSGRSYGGGGGRF